MDGFPDEFSRFVRPAVWGSRRTARPIAGDADRVRWFAPAMRPQYAAGGLVLLEKHVAPHLRPVHVGIDPASITGMRRNYTESLSKTVRNSSVSLNGSRSAAVAAARSIGLMDLMCSESLREFAAAVSGSPLKSDPGLQVIRYCEGDYVGPHNDHHPEYPHLRDGYVDLQITLCNAGVARQYFVYEKRGYLNAACNVGVASGVSVSRLPYWHQVTPLEVKPGCSAVAHRWLLLVSFQIGESPKKRG